MSVLRILCFATAMVLIGGCGKRTPQVQQLSGSSPSPGTAAVTALDRNILINGDAEAQSQASKDVPEGWSRTADVVAMNYGGVPDEWQTSKPGCPDGRERYFRLALSINEPAKSINQRITLIGLESEIDAGHLECALGGWFGGWVGGDASAKLEVDFLNGDGAVLGTAATDVPDPATLQKPETGKASLTRQIAAAPVPAGTRKLEVRITAVRPAQKVDTNAVAVADGLSVVLRKKSN